MLKFYNLHRWGSNFIHL